MRLSATRLTSMAQAGGGRTPTQRAIAVLRKFGSDAHVYLPGVGMLNGLQAGNYIHSNGTGPGTVDQPVGLVLDAAGGLGVELASVQSGSAVALSGNICLSSNSVAANKSYRVEFDYVVSSGSAQANIGNVANTTVTGTGKFSNVTTPGSGGAVAIGCNAATASITNFTVREVTGIAASQPTTSAKPILRRGAVNLLTYSGDFSNAVWVKLAATSSGELITTSATSHILQYPYTVTPSTAYTFAFEARRGSMTDAKYSVYNGTSGVDIIPATSYFNQINSSDYVTVVVNFTVPAGCLNARVYVLRDSGSIGTLFCRGAALFAGTYTAAQIQALGGIPLTLTAPVSTALGAYWWDTSGSKSLVATFPAGNESVTVINATPTGQVTTTAQNVVGAYSINTNTNGRIIVKGALSASELALLQSYANRLAGL